MMLGVYNALVLSHDCNTVKGDLLLADSIKYAATLLGAPWHNRKHLGSTS